jgi:multidrug efflux pump subunit AcrA (membrane-fusion protein)
MTNAHPSSPRSKKGATSKWLLISALIAVAGLLIYRGWASTQKRSGAQRMERGEIPVKISPAVRKHLVYSLEASGDIAPLMQVDLFPKMPGYLEKINVRIGDPVHQGQIVAQVNQGEFVHKVKEAEAKVAQAKASYDEILAGTRTEELRQAEEAVKEAQSRFENAKVHRERMDALYKKQIISKKDFDNAETECTVCEAQLSSSQERLKQLQEGARNEVREASRAKLKEMEALLAQEQIRLQDTQILAPFSGEISRKYVDVGALVSPSTPLMTLVHTATLKVVANVLEKDIPLIKHGMVAKIHAEAYPDRTFEGKVTQINSALDLSTRTLQVEIYIPNTDRSLKPGMFSKIDMTLLEKPQTLFISREAVLQEEGKPFVFVVEGAQALRKPVVLGYEQGNLIEVLDGLKEGDRVVVRGQESLKDRSTIQVVEEG